MTKTETNQAPPWKINGNESKLLVYKIAYYSNEHVESFFELEIIKKYYNLRMSHRLSCAVCSGYQICTLLIYYIWIS